jgi:hypothetical protein
MISREDIKSNIDHLIKDQGLPKTHLNSVPEYYQKRKFGVDIFMISIKGRKDDRHLSLEGLYRIGVERLLIELGICKKYFLGVPFLIRKTENIIEVVTLDCIKDLVINYIKQLPELNIELEGVCEKFSTEAQTEIFYRQSHIVLNQSGLKDLLSIEESEILSDNRETSFVAFKNGVVKINSESTEILSFNEIDNVIWKSTILPRELLQRSNQISQFEQFLNNVCSQDEKRKTRLKTSLGYLMHSYHSSSNGQIILLYDEVMSEIDCPMGGTGKGICAQAISKIREVVRIDGKNFSKDNRFKYQQVSLDTKVIWIDDPEKNMDIDQFNSISTDGLIVEQKFIGIISFPPDRSPKILICSNTVFDQNGTTRKRRQLPNELSDYYSGKIQTGVEEPITEEHGGRFFSSDWDEHEWNAFDWFMIDCLQLYMKIGLQDPNWENIAKNRTRQQIGDDLYNWIEQQDYQFGVDYETKTQYEEYKGLFEQGNDRFAQGAFTRRLKKYCVLKNLNLEVFTKSISGVKTSFFRIRNQENMK